MIFARKMPKFYVIIARKIFFPNFFFGGGARAAPLLPVSYAYGHSAGSRDRTPVEDWESKPQSQICTTCS